MHRFADPNDEVCMKRNKLERNANLSNLTRYLRTISVMILVFLRKKQDKLNFEKKSPKLSVIPKPRN